MKTIEKISKETTVLVEYAANACGSARVAEVFGVEDNAELKTLLSDFEEEYDEVEVDPEGATAEQDAQLNAFLESYRKKIHKQILLNQLKAARMEKGYSQERIAHECGMTMNNYARIERGDNGTTIATFERIANALGYRLTLEKL